MINKLLKFFVIFLVVLGISFSNVPFYALTNLIDSYEKMSGIVDKMWLVQQNHDSDVVDNFSSLRNISEKLRVMEAMAAAPTFVNKGAFASGVGALTVGVPAAYLDNDVFLLFVESANEAIATPAGWTQVTNSPQGTGTAAAIGGVRLGVFYKIVTGAQSSVSVADTGNHTTAIIMGFRGVDTVAPVNISAGAVSAATTAMSLPTVTTTVVDTFVVLAAAMDTDAASTATVTGWANGNLTGITERHDQTVTSGVGGGLAIATGVKATAGATGATTATGSTSVTHAYLTIALNPYVPPADTTPPTPSPMTFATAPNNTSATQIDMTATTATDATTPPVSYYFALDTTVCTAANIGTGAADSGWQSGTTYSDIGLAVNKCYGYKVKARDSVGTPNETGYSGITTLYTSANTPSAPTVGSPTQTTLVITNNENGNPLSNPVTYFAAQVTTADANWNGKWVNASGASSATAVWLTDAQLTNLTVTGLTASTLYDFNVKARNEDLDETGLSTAGSGTTSAPAATLTISASAGSKVATKNSGDVDQYAHDTTCTGAASCAAFTLAAAGGTVNVTSIKITESGTATANTELSDANLYYDTDGNWADAGAETLFGTAATFAADQTATISGTLAISAGATAYIYVRYDLANGAVYPIGGATVNFQIAAAGDVISDGTESGTGTLAGATTILPNVTSYSNSTEPALTDGGRETNTISVSGAGFGATCNVAGGNKVSIGAYDLSCIGATFSNTTITIPVDAAIPDSNNGGTGASGLLVTIGSAADDTRQTFYVYPTITSIVDDFGGASDTAREYDAGDNAANNTTADLKDGEIQVDGNHFGSAAGTITILGQSATPAVVGTRCGGSSWTDTCITVRVPTTIGDGAGGASDYTGNIVVTRTGSINHSYSGFRILPRIISTGPVNLKGGRSDTGVSITGDHLCQDASCVGSPEGTEDITFNAVSGKTGSNWTTTPHTQISSITIPATATDGPLIVTSDADGAGTFTSNSLTFDVKFAPTAPTNSTPTNGATGQLKNPTLTAGAFSDGADGDTHATSNSTNWQITRVSADYGAGNKVWERSNGNQETSVLVDSTNGTFTNTTLSTELNCGTVYYWHERYRDNGGVTSQEWSLYSSEFSFTTSSCGPDANSVTNNDEAALTDGGRIGQTQIIIGGSGFGTVSAGSRANCAGGAGTGCVKIGGAGGQTVADARVTAWSNASITITLSLTDLTTTYGGATTNGLIVYAAGVSDSNGQTFYVYPDITSLTAPLGTNDGAREYAATDTDGIITITGNKFGTAPTGGQTVIVGGTVATYVADVSCDAVDGWTETCIKVQVPTTISDSTDSGYIIVTQGTGANNKTSNSTDANGAINIWPRVTGISAASFADGGYQDGAFTLGGNHFGATAGTISVNGQTQDGTPTWGAASITNVGIPNTGTDSGSITLTRSDAKTSNALPNFYIYPQITSFTAAQGTGDIQTGTITITGNHFGAGGGNANITINGVAPSATTPTWAVGSITNVDIPNGGNDSGVIVVTNPTISKTSNDSTAFYIYPQITGIIDDFGGASDTAREYDAGDNAANNTTADLKDGEIQIDGNHFGSSGAVTILGQTATQAVVGTRCSSSSYTSTCITVRAPTTIGDGAGGASDYTGSVVVNQLSSGRTSSSPGFRILPRITALTPSSGATNDSIVIVGNHFCQTGTCPISPNRSTASDNVTFFNSVQVTDGNVTVWGHGDSATLGVTANVPSAAATGVVVVESNNYNSNGVTFTKQTTTPNDPTGLQQYRNDGTTSIAVGNKTADGAANNLVFKVSMTGFNPSTLCLQVENALAGTAFSGAITAEETGAACESYAGAAVTGSVTITGLTATNGYHWRARVKNSSTAETSNWVAFGSNPVGDGSGDGSPANNDYYIDTAAPVISDILSSAVTASGATITWNTNEISDSKVMYGTSCAPGSGTAVSQTGGVFPHSVALSNLSPNTAYQYQTVSVDRNADGSEIGNSATGPTPSTCNTFTTSKAETRTTEFFVAANAAVITGGSTYSPTFTVYIPESSYSIQSAFLEISGIFAAESAGSLAQIDASVNAQTPVSYTVNTSTSVNTPFNIIHQAPLANLNVATPTNPTNSNTFNLTVASGDPSVSIAAAKIVVTYYHAPAQ